MDPDRRHPAWCDPDRCTAGQTGGAHRGVPSGTAVRTQFRAENGEPATVSLTASAAGLTSANLRAEARHLLAAADVLDAYRG